MKIKQPLLGVSLGLAALVLAACGGTTNPLGEASPTQPSESAPASAPIVVGSADFTESKILAEIYSQALMAKGVESSTKLGIGSREIYIKALQDQSISAVPEYTGNLLVHFDANATATTAAEVEKALPAALPSDLKLAEELPRCQSGCLRRHQGVLGAARHHIAGGLEQDRQHLNSGRPAGA